MKDNIDEKKKIISLYKFLLDFSKMNYKNVINVKDYLWTLLISDIPEDPNNISVLYRDVVTSDETIDDDFNKFDYLLKVHKPEFQKCPQPPDILKEWLLNDWDNYRKKIIIKEYIEHINVENNEMEKEYFYSDLNRKKEYEKWLEKRKEWVGKQLIISRTRDFFIELYKRYNDLQREIETNEIIVANGYIKDNNNSNIYHPIITKRLSMDFDATTNTMYIRDTNVKSELYSELFSSLDDINLDFLSILNTDMMQNDYHPMDRNETKDFLKRLTYQISPNSKFVENEDNNNDVYNNRILVYFKPCIIIRKRLDGTTKAIEQIIKNIENTGFIPNHLLDIVNGGVLEKPKELEEGIEETLAKVGGESVDILLAKEANKEQLEIAKRIDRYNAVLVQGPPGTGKTHTIANLVGHFLAKGKSVLVTSYTKKALSVLKEKLPISMQSLCVSVLEESNKDMENSIDGITEYMSKCTSSELNKQKNELKQDRLKIIDELSKTRKKIYDILNTEYKSIILNGEEISPLDAASFVLNNKEKLNYINGSVELYSPLPLSLEDLKFLYSTNSKITNKEEEELNYKLPDPSILIKPKTFEEYLVDIKKMEDSIKEIAEQQQWKLNIDKHLFFETQFGDFYVPDLNESNLNELKEFIANFEHCDLWCRSVCCDGKKGGAYKKKWTTLIKKIKNVSEFNEKIIENHFGKRITCELNELIKNKNSILKLQDVLIKNKKVNKLYLLVNNELNKLSKLNIVNGKPLETREDCEFVLKYIDLCNSRNDLSIIWDELMVSNGVSKFYDLDEKEPEKVAEKYIDRINVYLDWYSKDYQNLIKFLKKTNIPEQIVLQVNNLDKDIDQINKIFDSLENVLPYIVDICINKIKIDNIKDIINNSIDILDDNLLINSTICINMKKSLINNNSEEYLNEFRELEKTYGKYETLHKRDFLLQQIEKVAPQWGYDIRNRIGVHGENICPLDIEDAWKYKQLNLILEDLTKESLDVLQKRSQKLSSDYRKITEEYAAKCAWYELLSRTERDIDMKQALKGWELTIKKIGKGTGKNAAKYKAHARELMVKCQDAVPCWIMPINKAIESLKPGENQFDIIIIDEASQSDITSLAISYFGKKMIVVGDDKQVSPMSIGLEAEKVNALEQMYLKNVIPNSHLYGLKTSLYDIAATTFQPLMLREHFRCVPEIIGFSNMLSYDFKIKPLRDSGSSNLLPAVINYRVDGKRIGKVNRDEAEVIVSHIKACLGMKEYDGKTFGVISLLGDEQVKLIQSLMFKYIEPREIETRKILIGNASNFQGDERDVIFLSMVDSGNLEGGPLSFSGLDDTKKRYNVAVSRAKDQLWVINSLDAANDLKPGDIRKKLLDYANDPKAISMKFEEVKKKSDSVFEEQVANKLISQGYHVIQQYPVGAYRLDIVVACKNHKVAIECDGERYHSGYDKVCEDMQRQAILERSGWQFIRIRGSQYFKDPELAMQKVITQLNSLNIYPENEKIHTNESRISELLLKVKLNSAKYLKVIKQGEESIIDYKDVLYALDSNMKKFPKNNKY